MLDKIKTPLKLKNPDLLREQSYVNGEWLSAADKGTFAVTNPADGSLLANVAQLGVAETRQAIAAASAAWPAWRKRTAKDRAAILRRWYELILANKDDLAMLMTAEQGKPLAESAGEVMYGASFIEWFAEEGKRIYGDMIPSHLPDRRIMVIKQSVGVVAAITPWNFPNAMITRKAAPALAAGCPIVIKPASETPLSALALAELAHRQVFRPACSTWSLRPIHVTLANDGEPAGAQSSFTGSTGVGKILIQQCASTVKRFPWSSAAMPFIVFDDADMSLQSKAPSFPSTQCRSNLRLRQPHLSCRRVCTTNSWRSLLPPCAPQIGRGEEAGVNVGPMISPSAIQKVEELLEDAVKKGGAVVEGGSRHALGGLFFAPTVVSNATADMAFATEEIFGPVAPIFRFVTEQDAINLANATEYGLASYFYARDLGRVFRVAEELEYGMVCINDGILSTEVAPFGGMKESGSGREGSKYGIDEYVEIKYITLAGLNN
jgi:succinate-semialdehyde dehydrogenase/glutarate-semialdehyde dehydrogenase